MVIAHITDGTYPDEPDTVHILCFDALARSQPLFPPAEMAEAARENRDIVALAGKHATKIVVPCPGGLIRRRGVVV